MCVYASELRKCRNGMVDRIVCDGETGIAHGERCDIIKNKKASLKYMCQLVGGAHIVMERKKE
jgi:hypothetical protein